MLSIGALSRTTGIPVETLRTWEARYGYPVPDRKPSGHRLYPVSTVSRLERIALALAHGHRAGEVVGATDDALAALLDAVPTAPPAARRRPAADVARADDLLEAVAAFDAEGITERLAAAWSRRGPLDFLMDYLGPAIRAAGDAWEAGRLGIRHEHFFAERVSDVLRAFRLPFEERARGPLVVCATLAGEAHGLGLQMAALVVTMAGARVCFVGTDVPVPEVAALVEDLGARVVALSASVAHRTAAMAAQIVDLRARVPRRVLTVVGGEGAPAPAPGVEVIRDLGVFYGRVRRLVTVR
ncbi:MAG: cobalamin-dependent protein [Candidatus Binatia bacterium]